MLSIELRLSTKKSSKSYLTKGIDLKKVEKVYQFFIKMPNNFGLN